MMQRELLAALLCLVSVNYGIGCSSGGGDGTTLDRGAQNRSPTISGSPPSAASVDEHYSFTPTASDPEGRTLKFKIRHKPGWVTFDKKTGRMSGSPKDRNIGSYPNIAITVSDGRSTTTLPAFTLEVYARGSGSATVSWAPPTQNTDGTTLSNLAGYRIYYGHDAHTLDRTVVLNNPELTRYVIAGLSSALWYFSMTSIDGSGNESRRSETVSKHVG